MLSRIRTAATTRLDATGISHTSNGHALTSNGRLPTRRMSRVFGTVGTARADLASRTVTQQLEVAIVASMRDGELLGELEDEMQYAGEGGLHEEEMEDEAFIGGLLGNLAKGIFGGGEGEEELEGLGEFEDELAGEMEMHEVAGMGEFEDELAGMGETEDEAFIGGLLGNLAKGLFGGGEGEWESEEESGEAFFRLIRRALPALRNVVRTAVPAIAGAFGGPLGSVVGGLLREGEFEDELAHEIHELPEIAHETEMHETSHEMHEVAHEYEAHAEAEVTESEAHAELMAAAAAGAQSEAEAEALIGAATLAALTPRERRQLRQALAHMVRATAILTRLLRRRRITRPMVRAVPTIVHHTARTLTTQQARTGRPITRRQAARAMSTQTPRVLTSPHVCGGALRRNVRATRRMQRVARVPIRGTSGASYRRQRARY